MRSTLFLIAVILPLVLGCGIADRVSNAVSETTSNSTGGANVNANKSLTDKAVDTAVGERKVGIAECDEAIEILVAQTENPDDNFVTKAIKKTALNTFREQLKKSLEDNKTDKTEVAKFCKEFRDNLADPKSESNANTGGSF